MERDFRSARRQSSSSFPPLRISADFSRDITDIHQVSTLKNLRISLSKKGYTSMEEILGQIFGIVIMILCVINTQFPKRWQMLLCTSLVNLFSSLNQLLVGSGLTACFLCAVATVHCAINSYKAKREISERLWEKILFIALYFTAWGIGFAFSLGNGTPLYLDLMTLVATIFFMGIVLIPRERDMRLCTQQRSLRDL